MKKNILTIYSLYILLSFLFFLVNVAKASAQNPQIEESDGLPSQISEATFKDGIKEYLCAYPALMRNGGCRILSGADGRRLLVAVGMTDTTGKSPEQIQLDIRQNTLAELAQAKEVRVTSIDKSQQQIYRMTSDGEDKESTSRKQSYSRQELALDRLEHLPTIGEWYSDDGKILFRAIGKFLDVPKDSSEQKQQRKLSPKEIEQLDLIVKRMIENPIVSQKTGISPSQVWRIYKSLDIDSLDEAGKGRPSNPSRSFLEKLKKEFFGGDEEIRAKIMKKFPKPKLNSHQEVTLLNGEICKGIYSSNRAGRIQLGGRVISYSSMTKESARRFDPEQYEAFINGKLQHEKDNASTNSEWIKFASGKLFEAGFIPNYYYAKSFNGQSIHEPISPETWVNCAELVMSIKDELFVRNNYENQFWNGFTKKITVTGTGKDRNSALQDAYMKALVEGTKTYMEVKNLTIDDSTTQEILSNSRAYISGHEILSESIDAAGNVCLRIEISLSEDALMQKMEMSSQSKVSEITKTRVQTDALRLENAVKSLGGIFENYPQCIAKIVSSELSLSEESSLDEDYYELEYTILVSIDVQAYQAFSGTLRKLLASICKDKGRCTVCNGNRVTFCSQNTDNCVLFFEYWPNSPIFPSLLQPQGYFVEKYVLKKNLAKLIYSLRKEKSYLLVKYQSIGDEDLCFADCFDCDAYELGQVFSAVYFDSDDKRNSTFTPSGGEFFSSFGPTFGRRDSKKFKITTRVPKEIFKQLDHFSFEFVQGHPVNISIGTKSVREERFE